MKHLFTALSILLLVLCLSVSACADAPQINGLTFAEETPLTYARSFRLYRYEGGYTLISIPESGEYLVVPEGSSVPAGLSRDIVVLRKPLDRIYLAATSAMALFDAVDAVDHIRFSGTQASGWFIDSAVEAMENGSMLFAGKYSTPDYERLCFEDCGLAIESTMIYHTPKVKESLEALEIPVLVDRASYESHPLGRTEWIKLYAVLTGKEEEANAFFEEQIAVIEQLKDFPNTGKTVTLFYVSPDGSIVVRNPRDYLPQMVGIGGGIYCCPDLSPEESGTTVAVTMESFYAAAMDADFLIYNSTIDLPLESLEQLMEKNPLFADFKAVKNGNVWCSGKSLYQRTDIVGQLISDIHNLLTEADESRMTFLTHVE